MPLLSAWVASGKLPLAIRLMTRYLALRRDLPEISPKVLTQNLRELEKNGPVTRTDHDEQPRRVEDGLSARNPALRAILVSLRDLASGTTP